MAERESAASLYNSIGCRDYPNQGTTWGTALPPLGSQDSLFRIRKHRGRRKILTDALITALHREADMIIDGKPTKRLIMIAEQLVKKACEGDLTAIREVWDRVEGKAIQITEHAGPENKDLAFTVRFVDPDGSVSRPEALPKQS